MQRDNQDIVVKKHVKNTYYQLSLDEVAREELYMCLLKNADGEVGEKLAKQVPRPGSQLTGRVKLGMNILITRIVQNRVVVYEKNVSRQVQSSVSDITL